MTNVTATWMMRCESAESPRICRTARSMMSWAVARSMNNRDARRYNVRNARAGSVERHGAVSSVVCEVQCAVMCLCGDNLYFPATVLFFIQWVFYVTQPGHVFPDICSGTKKIAHTWHGVFGILVLQFFQTHELQLYVYIMYTIIVVYMCFRNRLQWNSLVEIRVWLHATRNQ